MARLLRRKARLLVLLRCEGSIPSFFPSSQPTFSIPGSLWLFPFRTREAVATLTWAEDAISRSPILPFLGETFFFMRLEADSEPPFFRLRYFFMTTRA